MAVSKSSSIVSVTTVSRGQSTTCTPSSGYQTSSQGWDAATTSKLWSTGAAAFQLSSPAWEAVIVQDPAPVRVTRSPSTVQAPAAAKLTARGEVVVALTVNGGSPTALSPSGPKVMAWSALPMATTPVALASL